MSVEIKITCGLHRHLGVQVERRVFKIGKRRFDWTNLVGHFDAEEFQKFMETKILESQAEGGR